MHCQKKTAEAIIESDNDYCLGVKGNQKKLLEEIQIVVAVSKPLDIETTMGHSRNRYEIRSTKVFVPDETIISKWPSVHSLVAVERIRRVTPKGGLKKNHLPICSRETAYFISSLPSDTKARVFHQGIRAHWAIENSLHYVKDVTLQEDASRIRTKQAPENMSVLKDMALNVFRKQGYDNMAQAIRLVCHDIPLLQRMILE